MNKSKHTFTKVNKPKSHWNYRIFKGEGYCYVGEAFYDESGKFNGYTEPIKIIAETPEELKETYKKIKEAFNKPIIEVGND